MSNIVNEHVEKYIRGLVHESEDYFLQLEDYAEEHHVPIIHKEVKSLLAFVVKSTNVRSVLEIGTAIGYSASVFARAMNGKGKITSIERRESYHDMAKENVEKLGYETEFDFRLGDAMEVLDDIDGTYDLIFVDAAKGHYQVFLDKCLDKLNPGGVIVSDNVLYQGMIASDEYVIRRKKTIVKRMRNYLDHISNHPDFTTTLLPISDGVALSYKHGGQDE
ncbi:O-methyltransferase [Acidaminobacter sp. JC074]|uniref:O-methyltransferase n=1 Tax=Acidaminobacter sp. JC074 TaxID=2530199 RepID=UPI001F103DA4|nr:O-methyltransferase [Acidaminobacter sp. JC074]MCH4888790.1 O-methyltransferase [Acidaminobacter sp. JC074]